MKFLLVPGALCVSILAASIGPSVAADVPTEMSAKVFAFHAQNGSGETGTVALIPQGTKTMVEVALLGAPADIPQPAHVHLGSCAKLDPTPKYPLTSAKNGVSTTVLDVPMSSLTGGGFAVNVHKSGDDIKTYVSCADLGS